MSAMKFTLTIWNHCANTFVSGGICCMETSLVCYISLLCVYTYSFCPFSIHISDVKALPCLRRYCVNIYVWTRYAQIVCLVKDYPKIYLYIPKTHTRSHSNNNTHTQTPRTRTSVCWLLFSVRSYLTCTYIIYIYIVIYIYIYRNTVHTQFISKLIS